MNPIGRPRAPGPGTSDWRLGLPVLESDRVLLRELVPSDAPSLFRELSTSEVRAYIPPPPPAVIGIERMILRGIERRRVGQGFYFGMQPAGEQQPVGFLQFIPGHDFSVDAPIPRVWQLGFVLSSRYWGTGLFTESATMALQFAFGHVGLEAVEAWVIAANQRGHRALEKLGGVPVRKPNTTAPDGRTADFVLWTLRNVQTGA